MKIIDSTFRSLGSSVNKMGALDYMSESVGIILTSNSTGEVTCRIGICAGINQKEDERFIAQWGGKLFIGEAIAFFPHHEKLIKEQWKYE